EFLGAMTWAATTVLPLAARAQPTTPVIGFLHPGSPEMDIRHLAAFRKGLGEAGYTDGRNVAIEFRWAHGDNSRLAELATDLARRQVAVIVSALGTAAALAAKAATTTIPIVFSAGTDPVEAGIVASVSRPGGNITGVNFMASEIGAKRLGILQELVPRAAYIALLVNRTNPVSAESVIKDVERAASAAARHIEVFEASNSREIEMAFAAFVQKRAGALV